MKYLYLLAIACILFIGITFAYADDAEAVAAAAAVNADIFTPEEREQIAAGEETHEFQAEVNRLMDILINSIYTTRDIFLRETISNAADALDKLRFLSLTQPELLDAQPDLNIKIQFEPEKKILRIIDTGIGMTKDDLINNLGVVAKSGTTEFVKAAQSGNSDALSLIGQFGVGFYSVYLVADRVTVRSKNPSDDQYVWESTAKSKYTIAKDPRGNTLGRGTEITLHLRPDSEEFLSDKRLTELVGKYSQFINFPIFVSTKKTITEQIEEPVDDATTNDDDVVVNEDEEKKPATKTVTRDVFEDVQVNTVKPLWTRSPSDVTEEEYKEFYKSFTKDRTDYLAKNHFSAEGDITFKSVLFIPSKAEYGFYDRYYENNANIKLFVKRVMISDDIKDLTPRYLNFVKGLLDSEDLPLNVNREMLSQNKIVSVMAKKVVRKVLDMLKTLANDEKDEIEKYNEQKENEKNRVDGEDNSDETIVDIKEPERLYTKFWREFGKSIKLGVLDDYANKTPLSRLLRFKSTKTSMEDDNDWVSLDEYLERKMEGQDAIYYLTGESVESIQSSPFLSRAKALGVEVLILNDPLDEYLVQSLSDYDGASLQSLSREGVKLPGAEKPNLLKQQTEDLKSLTTFLLDLYNKAPADKKGWSKPIDKVVVTHRLGSVPLAVVATTHGQSAGMERIMKAQALSNSGRGPTSRKTIEINPWHPVIKTLQEQIVDDKSKAEELAQLLLDSALITSGYGIIDQEQFAARLMNIVARSLDVQGKEIDAEPTEDIEAPVVEDATAAADDNVELDDANTIKIDPADIKINYGGNNHDEL